MFCDSYDQLIIGLRVVQFREESSASLSAYFEITRPINPLITTITSFSNVIGALTTLFFTNYCVGFRSDSEIGKLAVIGYLKSDSYISQSY